MANKAVLFEECPLLVIRSVWDVIDAHHPPRWRAYKMLAARAAADTEDGPWRGALKAFNTLGRVDEVLGHVGIGAERLAEDEHGGTTDKAANSARIADVLMRFHCNQFGFVNGAGASSPFFASAVYAFTSRANHSCDPAMHLCSKFSLLSKQRARKMQASGGAAPPAVEDDGALVARTARALAAGERLTFSYVSEEVLCLEVRQRRAHIREKLGFYCQCERCVREEAAKTAAVPGPTAAKPPEPEASKPSEPKAAHAPPEQPKAARAPPEPKASKPPEPKAATTIENAKVEQLAGVSGASGMPAGALVMAGVAVAVLVAGAIAVSRKRT